MITLTTCTRARETFNARKSYARSINGLRNDIHVLCQIQMIFLVVVRILCIDGTKQGAHITRREWKVNRAKIIRTSNSVYKNRQREAS
jgi:hypothetical protein